MSTTDPKADTFIAREKKWRAEFEKFRELALAGGLTEELKWGKPCYTLDGANVAIIQGFKEYAALMFFKGALLKDPKGLLKAPGASQAGRQVRVTSVDEIAKLEPAIKTFLGEAVAAEKAGLQVEMKQTRDYPVPDEFRERLAADPALKEAFEALTPGRQRSWLFHFAQPKQARTRESRIEKAVPRIFDGLGMMDR